MAEDTCDVASFFFAAADLQKASSSGMPAGAQAGTTSPGELAAGPIEMSGQLTGTEESGWEASFTRGLHESKALVEAEDSDVGSWISDPESGGAAVPTRMVHAEALLKIAEDAPSDRWKEKTAERALRVYYHAKWLAERNYANAAEHRYRESSRLARSCRRSVLASHSLARLGYFLIHWRREGEAAKVLQESMALNMKSNPLAPYLHGVLERKVVANDVDRLRLAEQAIINAGEQPSEELEVQRSRLIEEIGYWREAQGSSRHCLATSDVAYVLICYLGHVAAFMKDAFTN
jgi:hypothetical protein